MAKNPKTGKSLQYSMSARALPGIRAAMDEAGYKNAHILWRSFTEVQKALGRTETINYKAVTELVTGKAAFTKDGDDYTNPARLLADFFHASTEDLFGYPPACQRDYDFDLYSIPTYDREDESLSDPERHVQQREFEALIRRAIEHIEAIGIRKKELPIFRLLYGIDDGKPCSPPEVMEMLGLNNIHQVLSAEEKVKKSIKRFLEERYAVSNQIDALPSDTDLMFRSPYKRMVLQKHYSG